jgi:hypothetical protein
MSLSIEDMPNTIADNMSKYVSRGYVFLGFNEQHRLYKIDILHKFMEIQQISPPVEIQQIESLGGTLLHMLSKFRIGYHGLCVEHLPFLLNLCMKHIEINYFVVCVLQITRINIASMHDMHQEHFILPTIYTLLVFLTKYLYTINDSRVYWALDLIMTWEALFREYTDTYTLFIQDPELTHAFFEILKYRARGQILPDCGAPTDSYDPNIYVRRGLYMIYQCLGVHKLCFHYAYGTLFRQNKQFLELAIQHWPFILDENSNKLLSQSKISDLLEEENNPKSANKK